MFSRSFVDLYCLFSYSFVSQAKNGKKTNCYMVFRSLESRRTAPDA